MTLGLEALPVIGMTQPFDQIFLTTVLFSKAHYLILFSVDIFYIKDSIV